MKNKRFTKQDMYMLGVIVGLGITACVVLLLVPLDSPQAKWLPKCIFYQRTGLYCPGCGATRALSALLHGNWKASLHNNLLLFPGVLTATLLILKPDISLKRPVAVAIVVIIIGFTILRNIPCAPFTLLAPIPTP